jgi:hypothetical protein
MSKKESRQDPQGHAPRAAASRDEDAVNEVAENGISAEHQTGEDRAKQNREEDPPA